MRSMIRMAAAALAAAAALSAGAQQAASYQLTIRDPADQSTVFSDTGEVTVHVAVSPDLASGDSVELLVDGVSAGVSQASSDFELSGMARGRHVLQARIIDSTGNVGSISEPEIFYVWAASVLFPERQEGALLHGVGHRVR
jgi:hypothetical protein